MQLSNNEVLLPKWLDDFLFDELKANYCPTGTDMSVIDWNKNDILNYLGTYFPRSYAESYCIFRKYFTSNSNDWNNRSSISIFDFGCGTGGEVIGLLLAINEFFPNIKTVSVRGLDGNIHALRLFEKIINQCSYHISYSIVSIRICPIEISDFYDMTIIDSVITDSFDIIMSFKAVCEFVSKERFEKQNAYKHISLSLLPKLKENGIMTLVDVTTYNNVSQEWLPRMMDEGLSYVGCNVVDKNEGYNQKFIVSHSNKKRDISKIAWRIIKNNIL